MKKTFLFIAILLAVFVAISGCGSTTDSGNTNTGNNQPAGTPGGALNAKNFIANAADVPANSMLEFTYEGSNAMLVNFDGKFSAFVNSCPHKKLAFDSSSLKGNEVVCPWHGSKFNAVDGKNTAGPGGSPASLEGLKMIAIKVDNGKIYYVLS